MNKKQIAITVIGVIAFIMVFAGSQEYVKAPGYDYSHQEVNPGILLGGWACVLVVYTALMVMFKTKSK